MKLFLVACALKFRCGLLVIICLGPQWQETYKSSGQCEAVLPKSTAARAVWILGCWFGCFGPGFWGIHQIDRQGCPPAEFQHHSWFVEEFKMPNYISLAWLNGWQHNLLSEKRKGYLFQRFHVYIALLRKLLRLLPFSAERQFLPECK